MPFTVEIDHLPEETIEADNARDAARAVASLVRNRATIRGLPDDEPVQIKGPDRRPWGRNLTLADFRSGDIAGEGDDESGPVRDTGIKNYFSPDRPS